MRLAALCLLLCACTRTAVRTEESHSAATSEAHAVTETHAEVDTTRRVETGPVDETVPVEEYAPASEDAGKPGNAPAGSPPEGGQISDGGMVPAAPRTGQLLRRTVTVTHSAPVIAETVREAHADARSLAETHAEAKSDARAREETHLDVGLSWPVKAAIVAGLLVLLGVGWRFRGLIPVVGPWLGGIG